MAFSDDLYSFPSKPFVQNLCEEDEEDEETNTRFEFTSELFSKKRRKPSKYKQQPKLTKPITVLDDSDEDAPRAITGLRSTTQEIRENEVTRF
jgi:hypothetical protein